MIKVKICGNRDSSDIAIAVEMGADAIGLIVGARHRTEDELSPEAAAALLQGIPISVHSVLVTHLLTAESVLELHRHVPTSVIQLHDAISPAEIRDIRARLPRVQLIKAISVTSRSAIDESAAFEGLVDALLLDSRTDDRIGGTGETHDWQVSREIVSASQKPVILAGGLTPGNVELAIQMVKPYAVDVNSGVEFADGSKDPEKVRRFIRAAKAE